MTQKLRTIFWLMLFMIFAPRIRLVCGFSTREWCNSVLGLTPLQLQMCADSIDAFIALGKGHKLGQTECQYQFRGHRWNCSQVWHENAFGHIVVVGSREAAFTYAIASAGAVHTITEACAQGNISMCGCDSTLSAITHQYQYHHQQQQQQQHSAHSQQQQRDRLGAAWKWGGCSADIGFAIRFAKRFLDTREIEGDERSLMNLHNNRVGRKVVKTLLRTECKCHGVSGSCAMKTCWKSLPPFRAVGDALMKKYKKARHVHSLKIRQEHSLVLLNRPIRTMVQPKTPEPQPKRMDFVYLQYSPNYCEKNQRLGSLGTDGRLCNRTANGVDSCDLLCCGRGYNTHQLDRRWQCRCEFHWCCHVQCDECHERIEQYTCK